MAPPGTGSCGLDSGAAGFEAGRRSEGMQAAARKWEKARKQCSLELPEGTSPAETAILVLAISDF